MSDYETMQADIEKVQAKLANYHYQGPEVEQLKNELATLKKRVEKSKQLEGDYLSDLKAARGKGILNYRRIREKYAAKGLPVDEITLKDE